MLKAGTCSNTAVSEAGDSNVTVVVTGHLFGPGLGPEGLGTVKQRLLTPGALNGELCAKALTLLLFTRISELEIVGRVVNQ